MIENGTYPARAVHGSAVLGLTSKRTEQVAVRLRIVDGPYQGQSLAWYGYFTEKTEERTLESLRYMGWRGDDISDLSTVGDDQADDCEIVVEAESNDDGQVFPKVRWVNRGGRMLLKEQMSEQQARAFAARMKAKAIALRMEKGGAKNEQPAPRNARSTGRRQEPPPPTDDDIPF